MERGEQPDRGQLLAQYPALASQFQALFAEVDNLLTKAHLEHIDGVGSQPDVKFSLALPGAGTLLGG